MIRILVVEDQVNNMRLIEQIIEDMEMEVQHYKAYSGIEALQVARNEHFDLVLMDISLPDMSGIQIAQRIKTFSHFVDTPIIAVTAHALKDDEISFRTFFNDYISKPIDETQLEEIIKKWIGVNMK